MKILGRRISKGVGFLRLMPTDDEDFWYLYNLIAIGDLIQTRTHRKIIRQTNTGSKTAEKRWIGILLKVCEINYWAEQHLLLSIKGRNCRESHWLNLGQYHTYEVELNQSILIYKENWDSFHFNVLDEIKASHEISEVAALIMEEGVAHLCLISAATTRLKQKIEKHVVKKKEKNEQRDKSLQEFFHLCFLALEVDQLIDKVKCLLVASPGFLNKDFLAYFKLQTQKEQYKHYQKYAEKFYLAQSSNGYLNSLIEVLQDKAVQAKLEDTKAMQEVKVLDTFLDMLRRDHERVAYGKKDVQHAHSLRAIQTLMLSDKVGRARDPIVRREWLRIVEQVKSSGGEVFIFSSLHPSGKQLNNYTGIAAILHFKVQFDYEDEDEEFEPQLQQLQQQPAAINDMEQYQLNEKLLVEFDQFDEQE